MSTNPLPLTEQHKLIESCMGLVYTRTQVAMDRLPRDADRAAVLSAAMLGLVMAARRFDPQGKASFPTFAYLTIDWTILEELRSMHIVKRYSYEKAMRAGEAVPVCVPLRDSLAARTCDLDEEVARRERAEVVKRAVGKLRPRWRTAVELYYFKECLTPEVGKQMGVNDSRIVQILRVAREQMRPMLKKVA